MSRRVRKNGTYPLRKQKVSIARPPLHKPRTSALSKGKAKRFVCKGGPFDGGRIFLTVNNAGKGHGRDTCPEAESAIFTLNEKRGKYVGRMYEAIAYWVPLPVV